MIDKRFELLKMEFGSLYRLSKILGVTPNAVYNWQTRRTIPLKHMRVICALSEGRIAKESLRPDLFED